MTVDFGQRGLRPIMVGLAGCLLAALAGSAQAGPGAADHSSAMSLLAEHCFACHGPDAAQRQADLRLDTWAGATRPLPSGRQAVLPGQPSQSELVHRISATDRQVRMPPAETGPGLSPAQIKTLIQWIAAGAAGLDHWSFQPPQRPPLPSVKAGAWARNPIDLFVLAQLQQQALSPQPTADRSTLLRRVTLDLTGLPPTDQEYDAFLSDTRPDAYARWVDRLLHSPRYGEHRARYWLDAVRYADTHGLNLDNERSMWLYRDWVIRAWNENLPYDQFTIAQLAGDLLPQATTDPLVASGYLRAHVTTGEEGAIPQEYLVHYARDRLETTATVWLGLTAGCAACHDHKYDPLSQREYYQLLAFFDNLVERGLDENVLLPPPSATVPTAAQQVQQARWQRKLQQVEAQLAALSAVPADPSRSSTEQHAADDQAAAVDLRSELQAQQKHLQEQLRRLQSRFPATLVARERSQRRPTYLLQGGQYDRPGEPVEPQLPTVFAAYHDQPVRDRLDLARWLVSDHNPLTARVIVNRLWQQCFGIGLVETSDDFGRYGTPPSHPELLDWLAVELIDSGWDVKHLLRLIVTSATYRQSAQAPPTLWQRDPQNRLLARGPRFRLDAEMLRDQALAISGLLSETLGGRSVRPYQPPGIWEAVGYTTSNTASYRQGTGEDLYRRSLYTFWKRTAPPPTMRLLDAPSREVCVVRRQRSNTPTAALALLNDPQLVEAARHLAERMLAHAGDRPAEAVTWGYRLATGHPPDRSQIQPLIALYEETLQYYQSTPAAAQQLLHVGDSTPHPARNPAAWAAWTIVAQTLLNLDDALCKP